MFETNPLMREQVDRAVEVLKQAQRGEFIPHSQLEQLFGLPHTSPGYYQRIEKIRSIIRRDMGRELICKLDQGYRIPAAIEQVTTMVDHREGKSLRQLKRARKTVTATPSQELTCHQQLVKAAQDDRLSIAMKQVRSSRKIAQILYRSADSTRIPRPVPEPT